jgi:carbonic anhydrase
MTDKSFFSDDDWKVLSEAPLYVTLAMVAVAEHGPISMVKEAAASARAMAQPGDRGAASELIAAISHDAQSHEARHDTKEHRGKSLDQSVDEAVAQLAAVPAALAKLPLEEAIEVRSWLIDIAKAVAGASKGTSEREQATIDRIQVALGGEPAAG